ncbi:histone deacetylase family protein [Prochlorothrix hollandica]|uniref:histone deacetylase family protein n=1 Tax=Prochlorothrix hollandica TaxID=1223 RepID=UPI00333F985E
MLPIFYSDQFLDHDTGSYHPENPGRLTAIVQALNAAPWADQLDWRSPTEPRDRSPLDLICQYHNPAYVEAVAALAQQGGGYIDQDTVVSAQSYGVALLAVNAWVDGVNAVLQRQGPAFVLARPPGHHAMPDYGMGFCIFANAALAAYHALEQPGVNRVAIIDWDVHHGNGTQAMVAPDPRIVYGSLHQFPFYPGTGAATEQGYHGNVLNIPLAPGTTLREYQPQFEQRIIPFVRQFEPDLLIVSAGYDATQADHLAQLSLQPADFGILTQACLGLTPKVLFGLEGGYDYGAIAAAVMATLEPCLSR